MIPLVVAPVGEDMTDLAQQHQPRLFLLVRDVDETGVSGEGVVAKGVEFPGGQCLMQWVVPPAQSIVLYKNMDDLIMIHGHNGKTHVDFLALCTDQDELEHLRTLGEDVTALVGSVERLALSA